MRGILHMEVVPFYRAGKALADGRADHVDLLADLEHVDLDLCALLDVAASVAVKTEFPQALA